MLPNSPAIGSKRARVERGFVTHTVKDRWVLILLAAAILTALAPVFTVPYAFLDDYSFLVMSVEHPTLPQFRENMQFFIRDGRTLNGLLILLPFRAANRVEALSAVRFLGALGVVALASFVFVFLRSLRWRRGAAALLVTGLATLPPLLLFSSWTQQWPLPWAALFAGIAAVRLWRYVEGFAFAQNRPFLIPFLWLTAGFQIHQSLMSFFWFSFSIVWLTAPCSDAKKFRFLRLSLLVYGGAAALSLAAIRIPAYLGFTTLNARGLLTLQPLAKLEWFFTRPLMDASSLWWIEPIRWISLAVLLAGAAGLALMVWRQRTLASGLRAVAMVGVLLLTYLSNLVIVENWSSYRTQSALAATMLLLAACFWRHLAALLPIRRTHLRRRASLYGALALCPVMLIFARRNLNEYMVLPQNREFVAVSSAIKQRYTPEVRSFTVVQPDWSDSLAPGVRYDEFGVPSLFAKWVPVPFTKLALHDLGLAYDKLPTISATLQSKDLPPHDTQADAVVNAASVLRAERRVHLPPPPPNLGPELLQKLRKIESAYAQLKRDTGRDTNQIADLVTNYSGLPNWKGPYFAGERSTEALRTTLIDKSFSLFSLQSLQRGEGGFSSNECGGDVWKKAPLPPMPMDRCSVYIAVAPVPVGDMLFLNNQIDGVIPVAGADDTKGRLRIFIAGGAILYQLP